MMNQILLGVGIYLGVGFTIVLTFSFLDGIRGRRHTDVDSVGVLVFWPLFIVGELLPIAWRAPGHLMQVVHGAGLKLHDRHAARKRFKSERREFKALCKREGLPFQKMWKKHPAASKNG